MLPSPLWLYDQANGVRQEGTELSRAEHRLAASLSAQLVHCLLRLIPPDSAYDRDCGSDTTQSAWEMLSSLTRRSEVTAVKSVDNVTLSLGPSF